ncbi:MAG: phenylacetic acid degradation bifunctional protein PaaZ [Ahrensia sp.]|nr:phenylacetic acid degradation bifunctional protein PaaZ [Ahrensia sp.]
MEAIAVESYAAGRWIAPSPNAARKILSAVTGDIVAHAGSDALDFGSMIDHARNHAGPALRAMTFHDRARLIKQLALYLTERKEALYELSFHSGTTRPDAAIDIEGGIGTLFAYASKGRREMPDSRTFIDGGVEALSRNGSFVGQHICMPRHGVGVHINAFNFPVWGMLEKLAQSLLAGVPAIVKPATATSYVSHACMCMMVESGLFPDGAFQMIAGGTGDLLDRLGPQDLVSFTGSADTALKLRSNPNLLRNAVPFIAEQDSLNATMLGPDAGADTPEFGILVKEVVREMTAKAGQKCTAIRRILVPQTMVDPVVEAVRAKLEALQIGDPRDKATRLGALVSTAQRSDVLEKVAQLNREAELVSGAGDLTLSGADAERGAFMSPKLFHCADPDSAEIVHEVEAFGPVATVMAYRDVDHACAMLNRGGGSLVASLISHDPAVARQVIEGASIWHGRIYVNDRDSADEATGHGAPMPHMMHGGPGRAGGGEELGGIRGVMHYLQRTAMQGSSRMVAAMSESWLPGVPTQTQDAHPFTRSFHDLQLGDTLETAARTITLEDIEHFAHFTGDTFYAHMDEAAAKANPFFPGRVAHGYLLLSFAAGLFVQPDPGPVLANTGLSDLAFQKPVSPGDSIRVTLTVKRKTKRTDEYGEVRWQVQLHNQDDEPVASYTLHTMNAY